MHKRRLVTTRAVGTAMLFMVASTWSTFATDPATPTGGSTTPAASATKTSTSATDQITTLKQQMALQQKQIEQMQKSLQEQIKLLEQLTKPAAAPEQAGPTAQPAVKPAATTEQAAQPAPPATPVKSAPAADQAAQPQTTPLGQVASTSPIIPQSQTKVQNAAISGIAGQKIIADETTSPLQFHIGSATMMPVGFMDFTSVWRNKEAGGNIGASFGSIPYATVTGGLTPANVNLSEFRLSIQNSRIGFRADANVKGFHVLGYMEADFLGTPANLSIGVTNNAQLLRNRLYFLDVRKGVFELLGGQTWTLLTPTRAGISPLPSDIFYSQVIDVNYVAGLTWGRIPELRLVLHPNKQVAFAVALDSPDQYAGGSGGGPSIVLPSALSGYSSELDFGASSGGIATPNVAPDIIAKLAFDPVKQVHFEINGLERNFKVYNPNNGLSFSKQGGGGSVNAGLEPVKGVRFFTNNFWSDGGGRYIFGQAPDVIARADGSLSPVHAGSTLDGIEITQKKTLLYFYYGGIYVGRDYAVDADGKTFIGYGWPSNANNTKGAASSQNRTVQELTFGFNQTIWKDAKWGAVNFMGQYSYNTRNPWQTLASQPANANDNMVYFNLRYTLPGSAPTMGH